MKKTFKIGLYILEGFVSLVLVLHILFYLCGIRFYIVLTPSMQSVYPVGTLLYDKSVKDLNASDFHVGDDVTFLTDSNLVVTHRIVALDMESNLIQTQGVENETPDGWITPSSVIGKVIIGIPILGSVIHFFQNIYIWIMIILIIAICFVVKKLKQELKKKSN
jgi:signal peptidase I